MLDVYGDDTLKHKVHLQHGKYCSKLVGFKELKKYFTMLKRTNLVQFLTQCKFRFIKPTKCKINFHIAIDRQYQ
jgi:hypothetical protein